MSTEDGISIQRRQLKEHKKNLEASKLNLWKLKSDLSTVTSQLTTVERQLLDEEQNYANLVRRRKTRSNKLQNIVMAFTKGHAEILTEIASPTTMVQDVATVVTQLCGCVNTTWIQLITIMKDYDSFYESMKSFSSNNLDERDLDNVAQLLQKHQFNLLIGEGRLPEELAPLVSWAIAATDLAENDAAVKQLAKILPELSEEKQSLYLHKQELEDSVDEVETQLRELAMNIGTCENNLSKLGEKLGEDEVATEHVSKKHKIMTDAPAVLFEESSLKSDFYSEEFSKPQKPHGDFAMKPESNEMKSELPTIVMESSPAEPKRKLIEEVPKKKKKKRVGCCGLR
mmetsp:Transcript_21559/g.39428  ORF Transcript_21559/g.39428 Transcript_21559/m.39428 type:complete len:342 (+) Transcript_21559:148-1173(+)